MGAAGKCGRKSKYGKGIKTKTISIRVPVELHDELKALLNNVVELEINKNGNTNKENKG